MKTYQYKLKVANNHYVIIVDTKAYIMDTGSPMSLSGNGSIDILGDSYPTVDLIFTKSVRQIQDQVGMTIDGLIGNDILNGHVIMLDFAAETITFDEQVHDVKDCVDITFKGMLSFMPLISGMEVPIIEIELNHRKVKAIFDTGACISYVKDGILIGLTAVGNVSDFSPMHGAFQTTTYDVPYKIGSRTGRIIAGKATEAIISEIALVDAEAIIGPSIFEGCSSIVIDLKNMKLCF